MGSIKPGNCDFINERGTAKIPTAAARVNCDFESREPLDSFSRFRVSISLRSVVSAERTARSFFDSARHARILEGEGAGSLRGRDRC
jgi:hypothetical protein